MTTTNDYILFMHDDVGPTDDAAWAAYFTKLRASGGFDGGSSIGPGVCLRRDGVAKPTTSHLSGYIRVRAESMNDAKRFLDGNPVYEAGGTIELRELPRD